MEQFILLINGVVGMKKIVYTVAMIVSLVLMVGCGSNNSRDGKSMNINIDGIEKITVSTQTTEQKQDVILRNEDYKGLISKLNSYSIKEISDEKDKGWQYSIKIEKKGGAITMISFMDNKVKVNDIVYEVRDYNTDDFSYLFDSVED